MSRKDIIDQEIQNGVDGHYTANYVRGKLIARGIDIARRTIQVKMKKERTRRMTPGRKPEAIHVQPPNKDETKGSEDRNLEMYSNRVVTLDDALKKGKIDLDKWDVERFIVNSWEVGAKGPDKKIRVTPLWQVKVWLKAKKGWNPTEFKKILVDDMKKQAPTYRKPEPRTHNRPLLAELSIFDAHFGKLAWSPETGQDYDLKICEKRYMNAARDLLARVAEIRAERVLYVVGNDFFHTDHKGLTTAGTPQDCDGRWQKAFRKGCQCCITTAEEASQLADVDILVVSGNHDKEKAFCLGEVLGARFYNNHNINVINDPDVYSYYRWGKTLLGFVHGENYTQLSKRQQLPAMMATDRPIDWAETVWREFHLGHFHSETEDVWKYRTTEHIRETAVRVLPSLSSTDSWHREQGYASVLAAECHMYHKDMGRYAYHVHQTTP
jgi:hypothetical protein